MSKRSQVGWVEGVEEWLRPLTPNHNPNTSNWIGVPLPLSSINDYMHISMTGISPASTV